MYDSLLDIVETESKRQIKELEDALNRDANKNKDDWNRLVEFEVPKKRLFALIDPLKGVRQDNIANGIVSEYHRSALHQNATNSSFDGANFYDLQQFLPNLALNAQILDDEFQRSVVGALGIDKVTGIGTIGSLDDEKSEAVQCEYRRGPIKALKRAQAKAENDYFSEPYPTSAAVLDFNRCSLVFEDIHSLLIGLDVFVNKVCAKECGAIIGIARSKNGFPEYLKVKQYADIKLNVVISNGMHTSIIGEVQFLLRSMINYKQRAHSLYAIQREEEFIKGSAMTILPQLTNQDIQLKVAAASGNVKALCSVMLYGQMAFWNIKYIDERSILSPITFSDSVRALKFIRSMMNKEEFIYLLAESQCTFAIKNNKFNVSKYMMSIDAVCNCFQQNESRLNELICGLFVRNRYPKMVDIVMESLKLTPKIISDALLWKESKFSMLDMVILNVLEMFQKLASIVGEQVFVKLILKKDREHKTNALGRAIGQSKVSIIEYFVSFDGIKKGYESNKFLTAQCVFLMNQVYDEFVVSVILAAFNWNKDKLKEIQSWYPKVERIHYYLIQTYTKYLK